MIVTWFVECDERGGCGGPHGCRGEPGGMRGCESGGTGGMPVSCSLVRELAAGAGEGGTAGASSMSVMSAVGEANRVGADVRPDAAEPMRDRRTCV